MMTEENYNKLLGEATSLRAKVLRDADEIKDLKEKVKTLEDELENLSFEMKEERP